MIKGKLNLTALEHVKMTVKNKEGKPIEGLFIPTTINRLFVCKQGVYLDLVAFEAKSEFSTHIIKQSFDKKTREAMTEAEKKALPILGNLSVDQPEPEANNDAAAGQVMTPDQAMPWK